MQLLNASTKSMELMYVTHALAKYVTKDYVLFLQSDESMLELFKSMSHLFTFPFPDHVFITDDVFGQRFHDESKEKFIRDSGLLGRITWSSSTFHPILTGYSSAETLATTYETKLPKILTRYVKKCCLLAHLLSDHSICGILPESDGTISSKTVITYENEDTDIICITTKLISNIFDSVIIFVDSNEDLQYLNTTLSKESDIKKHPILSIRKIPNIIVIKR